MGGRGGYCVSRALLVFFFFKAREARPAGAKRERLELYERPSAMMRQQDSLIYSSSSSLSSPSDLLLRPPPFFPRK